MKKTFVVLMSLIMALSLGLFGCDGNSTENNRASDSKIAGQGEVTNAEEEDEPQEGYLDEATGIFHTTLQKADYAPISFSVYEGWSVSDGLFVGSTTRIDPPDALASDAPSSLIIWYVNTGDDAQEYYDAISDSESLGEGKRVTYGGNTYITNATPAPSDNNSYFIYVEETGKPVIYVYTVISEGNQAALEELLSTLEY